MSNPDASPPPPDMIAGMPPGANEPPPEMMFGEPGMPPVMSARPYIGRALKLLGEHKSLTAITMLLSLLVTLFPFIASVAFAAIFQVLGPLAGQGSGAPTVNTGASGVWDMTAPLFSKSDTSSLGTMSWLATPLTLKTILIVWTSAL